MDPIVPRLDAYKEREKLGKGNMLRAKRNNQLCALKRIPKGTLDSGNDIRLSIERELLQLKQLVNHNHVIKYHDYFYNADSSTLYVEMEWASKGNLHSLIARHRDKNRYFSEPTVWHLFLQIARGVQHIHCLGELVHRDLQPSNVLIMGNDWLKVGNLQLTECCDLQQQHKRGVYSAPEVLLHHAVATYSSDVWSLGCLLYELICLVPPFLFDGNDSNAAVARGEYAPIPEKPVYSLMLRNLVQAMLTVDSASRPHINKIVNLAEVGCRENPKPQQTSSPSSAKAPNSPSTASPLHSPWTPSPPPPALSSQLQGIRARPPSILIPHGSSSTAPALTTSVDNAPATAPVVTSIISPYSTQAIKHTYVRSKSNLSHHRLASPRSAGGFTPVPPSPFLPRTLHQYNTSTADGMSSPIPQSPRLARFIQVSDRHVTSPTPPPYPPPAMAANVSPKSAQLLKRGFDSPGGMFGRRYHRQHSNLTQVREETGSNRSSDTEGNSPSSAPRNDARERGAFHLLSISTAAATAATSAELPQQQQFGSNPFANKSANPFSKKSANPFATTGLITPKADDMVDFFPPPPPPPPQQQQRNRLESPRSSHKFPLWANARSASTSPPVPVAATAVVPEFQEEEDDATAYILGDVVGEGSFARVYRAVDCTSGVSVAIKQFTLTDHYTAENAEQMEKEILLLKELSHPNLVKYLGTRREPNKLNIVLEFCMVGSISQMLRSYTRFPENLIRIYTKQMNDGLIYLHEKNIVHRDIKGGNVLVSQEGSQIIVKLSDFGCSKRVDGGNAAGEQTMKQSKQLKGTVLWMAPEAARSSRDCGLASDIWSMGATVIEMATGRPPWDEKKFAEEIPALLHIATTQRPPQFPLSFSAAGQAFLRACMEIDPAKRPSARQLKLNPFFVTTVPLQEVRTAQVDVRPEIVGANAHRAAQKGRELMQDKEAKQMVAAKQLILKVMPTMCLLSVTARREVWLTCFTSNIDVSLPCVASPPHILGLPLFLRDVSSSSEGETPAADRVEGRDAFIKRFAGSNNEDETRCVFTAKTVESTKMLIQAANRVAMWKWEICGTWDNDNNSLCRVTGSASCMFDSSGEKIKSLELQWEPSSILAKRSV